MAKYLLAVLTWLGAMGLAFGITWGYTVYYFPDARAVHPVLGVLPLLVFGLLFMAATLLGSTLTASGMGGFFTAAALYAVMALLALLKDVKDWLPLRLVTDNLAVVKGTMPLAALAGASAVTVLLALGLLMAAIGVFQRKRL
ncbi:ABC transporter permease [Lacticaseibacillus daqingensis]|uniref:ABC transporter permease n=1 Tax=Lacticaseibacillus daqingensis TaxID=2486014 RepID=UPI000F7B704A|nr:ABC transporter permease [Lacticaseibacillus daqingensis]